MYSVKLSIRNVSVIDVNLLFPSAANLVTLCKTLIYKCGVILQNYMGRYIMTLTRVLLEGDLYDVFDLDGTKSGRLALNLKWTPQPIMRDV